MVRPGILLYGVYPSIEVRQTIPVQPALRWSSRVVYFKVVQPGHPVSYGSTWQSDHPGAWSPCRWATATATSARSPTWPTC